MIDKIFYKLRDIKNINFILIKNHLNYCEIYPLTKRNNKIFIQYAIFGCDKFRLKCYKIFGYKYDQIRWEIKQELKNNILYNLKNIIIINLKNI